MKFEKEMRGNSGQLPHEHKIAIDGILSLQSPLIPKIHSYDDYYYKADYIDGLSLSKYIIDKGDALWCQKLLFDINLLYLKMSEITHKGFVLCADDVHGNNIKVTMSGQAYIVDLDQYCWVEPWQVFDHIQFTYVRLCNVMKTSLIQHKLEKVKNELTRKAHHGADFEAGVRHGFWNVKSVEEIKENYENFKHLEEWYANHPNEENRKEWFKNRPKIIKKNEFF